MGKLGDIKDLAIIGAIGGGVYLLWQSVKNPEAVRNFLSGLGVPLMPEREGVLPQVGLPIYVPETLEPVEIVGITVPATVPFWEINLFQYFQDWWKGILGIKDQL